MVYHLHDLLNQPADTSSCLWDRSTSGKWKSLLADLQKEKLSERAGHISAYLLVFLIVLTSCLGRPFLQDTPDNQTVIENTGKQQTQC